MTYENATMNDSCETMRNFHGQKSEIQIWATTFNIEEIIKTLHLTMQIVGNI